MVSEVFTQAFKSQLKPVGLMFEKPKPKKKKDMMYYAKKGKIKLKTKWINNLQDYPGVIRAKKRIYSPKKEGKKKSKPKLPKKVKIKSLEAKLKKILYPLIKARDGNTCISCNKKNLIGGRYGNWNAGHFIKAEKCNLVYRYDVRNINSQCVYCNKWDNGATIEYRKAMIKKYGEKITVELETHYRDKLPMDFNEREYLLGLIKKYESKSAL